MQVHSLDIEDFGDDNYTLIGIHTSLEDFKLAYLLNNNLDTLFSKADYSLDFERSDSKASFSVYNYTNEELDHEWFLISNSYTEEKTNELDTILLSTETKTYLIPEKKKVDFFIKVSGELGFDFVTKIIDKVKNIEQVITSYPIDKNTLKSKDFLIF